MIGGPILLDLTRLLQRVRLGGPTGIDRVEQAYAEQLLMQAPERVRFVVVDRLDRVRLLPWGATARFVQAVGRSWRATAMPVLALVAGARGLWMEALLPGRGVGRTGVGGVYLLVSHHHLHRRERMERILAATGTRLVAFVHDLIPIEFPEYARPGHAARHLARMRSVAALAAGVVVNSGATGEALGPYLEAAGRRPPVLVAHLGTSLRPGVGGGREGAPYFLCLGTIEPRKNHLLLLHLWRRFGEEGPALIVAGRRGWENENVVDMLERAAGLGGVSERPGLSDEAVAGLLAGCRALLFPTFAEGFGLPVIEALAAGAPVICSDLPVLREVGGGIPEYLDPLDGPGWARAIWDYAMAESPRRAAQAVRRGGWRAPGWGEHVKEVLGFIDGLGDGSWGRGDGAGMTFSVLETG